MASRETSTLICLLLPLYAGCGLGFLVCLMLAACERRPGQRIFSSFFWMELPPAGQRWVWRALSFFAAAVALATTVTALAPGP